MTTAPFMGASKAKVVPAGAAKTMRKIWIDGEFLPRDEARISVYDHGFLYGDGCFEGIRAYDGRIFKVRSHLERLFASAGKIRLEPQCDRAQLEAAMRDALRTNGLRDAYIRLVVSRGVGTLGLHPFKCPKSCTVIIADSIELYPPELYEKGLKVVVAKRPRIPIACLDPAIKSLNYLNNILAKIEAIDAGRLEAIMLNLDGWVTECTGDNLFIVRDGRVLTPPTSAGMLHGITREFVLREVAPACGLVAEERMMRIDEVKSADEVFLTGTAAEIIGVTEIDDVVVADGRPGPVTRRLTDEFRRRVKAGAPED